MIKAQVPLSASYSPTIMNAALPPDADWIITTLEPHIAKVCGLDPAQEYQIVNALQGHLFYQHYKATLLAEGYKMSAFDNCLFYRTTATVTTYIIVYVDDTFIDTVIASMGKHYEVRRRAQTHPPLSSASKEI